MARRAGGAVVLMAVAAAAALTTAAPAARGGTVPVCDADGAPVTITGDATTDDAKTYRALPFDVADGTTRVEVGYEWTDNVPLPDTPLNQLVQTVFDLGLWDEDGVGTPAGFRGWSGSRQGKTAEGQDRIWVQADTAERGYRPGPVEAGRWHVDLGIAAVSPGGATYEVTVACLDTPPGAPFVAQPVDAGHVADSNPGWYHGDFHMHGRHSNANAPDWPEFVEFARDAGLDFLPVTDYVTDQHHRELGPVQAANPDLVIWPSREVITYFGHATVFGETPSEVDWRHGAPGVSLGGIQARSIADGALFGVAHPTIFPTFVFSSFCRGCEFTLDSVIDWDAVDTMEVLTGPILVDDTQLGGPGLGATIQNPFVTTAIDRWEAQLLAGHKITAVSGSDDKLGPGLGSSATAVHATELSRAGISAAVRAGHAYVRTLGVASSPTLEVSATAPDGETAIIGDTLDVERAEVTVKVQGASGQLLQISKDGELASAVPITGDDFTHTFTATRDPGSGPLGTFWRVDTLALASGEITTPYLTTIGNPIFLGDLDPTTDPSTPPTGGPDGARSPRGLPATGGSHGATLPLLLLAASLTLVTALAGLTATRREVPR